MSNFKAKMHQIILVTTEDW